MNPRRGSDDRSREMLIEAAVTAWRERDEEGRIVPPPAWWDLGPEAREEVYRRQLVTRVMERAIGDTSGTIRAVLARLFTT